MSDITQHPLLLGGGFGSPYSIKMRAVLRYRRIPFRWVPRGSRFDSLPPVPVALIPVIAFPEADGTYANAMIDSSPQIDRLETMFPERSLTPCDPVVAFVDALVEDYADEWLTKAMYHYRWYYDDAIDKAAKLLPLERSLQMTDERWLAARTHIRDRQIGRRALVGSTEENRAIIEDSYARLLDLMADATAAGSFLFGERPGRADFGLFGQLFQLTSWDPESARIAVERAPRVRYWIDMMDDLSWWETPSADASGPSTGWVDRRTIPPTTHRLLAEIGRTYAPFMVANAAAIVAGEDVMSCRIDDATYSQGTFAYQAKCLKWLRERYEALGADDREAVDAVLAGTGCEVLLT